MTAELLAFRKPPRTDDAQALLEAAVELHALISIDPVMGASPARVYFVFNREAKRRISLAIDGGRAQPPTAYALMAYDFPFALHLIEIAGRPANERRAKTIASLSAGLQGEALRAAADALGVEALPAPGFDAAALKRDFFANTQETVICLFRLELRPTAEIRQTPGSAQP
jgi:3-hydroxypropanoate dehydrogenase